jgi:hypothetical protein
VKSIGFSTNRKSNHSKLQRELAVAQVVECLFNKPEVQILVPLKFQRGKKRKLSKKYTPESP